MEGSDYRVCNLPYLEPLTALHCKDTEVCRLVEGAEAEVYTVVIILAIVLVYTDSHNTMANLVTTV
jgi:hypothetical protein